MRVLLSEGTALQVSCSNGGGGLALGTHCCLEERDRASPHDAIVLC